MKTKVIGFILAVGLVLTLCFSLSIVALAVLDADVDLDTLVYSANDDEMSMTITDCLTDVVPFSDVNVGDFYYTPVKWAIEEGITNGTSDTTFSPDNICTIAQILTFLHRAMGEPRTNSSCPFSDVNSSSPYYNALCWAAEEGIISTNQDGNSSDPCTRGDTVLYLWHMAGNPSTNYGGNFNDVFNSDVYAQAVAWAVKEGITNGTSNTTFSPNETCTRGQIVTFLYRNFAELNVGDVSKTEIPIDYKNLVTDAYRIEAEGIDFSIPQINIDSADAKKVNAKIWNMLYEGVIREIEDSVRAGYEELGTISYQWAKNGDILSVWIECCPNMRTSEDPYYYIYSFSISEGKLLSNRNILKYYNLTKEDYKEKAKQALYAFHFDCYEKVYSSSDVENISLAKDALKKTLSDNNIANATLFVNDRGKLCIFVNVYSIAGADYYEHIINLEDFDLPEHYPDGYKRGVKEDVNSYVEAIENCIYKCGYTSLTKRDKEVCRGLLYDLNDDGQEELILRYVSDHSIIFEVWSIVTGKTVCVHENRLMGGADSHTIMLLENSDFNELVYRSVLAGSSGDTEEWYIYSATGSKYQQIHELVSMRMWDDETESEEYRIDGKAVSETEFNKVLLTINNGTELMKTGTQAEGMLLPDLSRFLQEHA